MNINRSFNAWVSGTGKGTVVAQDIEMFAKSLGLIGKRGKLTKAKSKTKGLEKLQDYIKSKGSATKYKKEIKNIMKDDKKTGKKSWKEYANVLEELREKWKEAFAQNSKEARELANISDMLSQEELKEELDLILGNENTEDIEDSGSAEDFL